MSDAERDAFIDDYVEKLVDKFGFAPKRAQQAAMAWLLATPTSRSGFEGGASPPSLRSPPSRRPEAQKPEGQDQSERTHRKPTRLSRRSGLTR
jgi:hypothetical protein